MSASTTEILDVAPIDIFSGLSKEIVQNFPEDLLPARLRDQALDVEFHWVTEHGKEAKVTAGGTIKATVYQPTSAPETEVCRADQLSQHDFETCPTLDITLMGAHDVGYIMTPGEVAFIKKCHEDSVGSLFICGGFIAALQAGLLEGKTATAPRSVVESLRKAHPEVNWVAKRWAHDANIWTSGALLNGTDMTKAFAMETWGGEGTLVEFWTRLGGYPDRDIDYADVPWEL